MLAIKGSRLISLNINGEGVDVIAKPSDTLLFTLRSQLGLTGVKPGCENGDCGACTLLIDDMPIKSCLTLTVEAIDKKIMTVEGLMDAPVQRAFVEERAFQCGYCTSGFLMVCHSLSKKHPHADDATIAEWLDSNICRCTGYQEIKDAAKSIINNTMPQL